MKKIFLCLIILSLTAFTYAQEENKGLVAYGSSFYKYQYSGVNENGKVDFSTEKIIDSTFADFSVAINTNKKFLLIKDAGDFPAINFKFDTIEVEDYYEMFAEINSSKTYTEQGYQSMNELNFNFDYDFNDKVIAATGKLYYDFKTKQMMFNISIVKNGNGFFYFFTLDKIFQIDWEYENIMSKKVETTKEKIVEIGKDNDKIVLDDIPSTFLITDTEVSFTEKEETTTEQIIFRKEKDDFLLIYTKKHLFAIPTFLNEDSKCYYYYDIDPNSMKYTKQNIYKVKSKN